MIEWFDLSKHGIELKAIENDEGEFELVFSLLGNHNGLSDQMLWLEKVKISYASNHYRVSPEAILIDDIKRVFPGHKLTMVAQEDVLLDRHLFEKSDTINNEDNLLGVNANANNRETVGTTPKNRTQFESTGQAVLLGIDENGTDLNEDKPDPIEKPPTKSRKVHRQELPSDTGGSDTSTTVRQLGLFDSDEVTNASDSLSTGNSVKSVDRTRVPTKPQQPNLVREIVSKDYFSHKDLDTSQDGQSLNKAYDNALEAFATVRLKQTEEPDYQATIQQKSALFQMPGLGSVSEPQALKSTSHLNFNPLLQQKVMDSINYGTEKLTQYFTPVEVAETMWNLLQASGFKSGRVLETSGGNGRMIGAIPAKLKDKVDITLIEKDPLLAGMAKIIHPSADVRSAPFETVPLENEPDFDVVIGNFPFGNLKIAHPESKYHNYNIINYFMNRSLDLLKPGGMMLVIVSSNFMNSAKYNEVRQFLGSQINFHGAVRLPSATFSDLGTEVVSDLLVLQKIPLDQQKDTKLSNWIESSDIELPFHDRHDTAKQSINEYFLENPQQVLGEQLVSRNGPRSSLYVDNQNSDGYLPDLIAVTEKMAARLNQTFSSVQQSQGNQLKQSDETKTFEVPRLPDHFILGALEIFIDKQSNENIIATILETNQDSETGSWQVVVSESSYSKNISSRVKDYITLKHAVFNIMEVQLQTKGDTEEYLESRNKLNRLYDQFVKRHGYLNLNKNLRLFNQDPLSHWVSTLETLDNETEKYVKSPVFNERVINEFERKTSAETVQEAAGLSLSEYGEIDLPYMTALLNSTEQEVQQQLASIAFFNPKIEKWELSDIYLSGDIRLKLEHAEYANQQNEAKYKHNVQALKNALPDPIQSHDIRFKLGANYMPTDYIEQYIGSFMGVSGDSIKVTLNSTTNKWEVDTGKLNYTETRKLDERLSNYIKAGNFLTQTLNQSPVTIKTKPDPDKPAVVDMKATLFMRNMQKTMNAEFSQWLASSHERLDRVTQVYNYRFNRFKKAHWDGQHLEFPGMNKLITMKPHQKNAVWRALVSGNMCAAHDVGAGKTFVMIAYAMKAKEWGAASKPLLVVKNPTLPKFVSQARFLYPNAKIYVLDKSKTTKANRTRSLIELSQNNWDLVIIPHSTFSMLRLSPENEKRLSYERLESLYMMMSEAEGFAKRGIRTKIDKMNQRIEESYNNGEKYIFFDKMGVDLIAIDEAHAFKNLGEPTSLVGVKGLSSAQSNRALNAFNMERYLTKFKLGEEKNVIWATGTPITNSFTEVYTIFQHLSPSLLTNIGIHSLDQFIQVFTEPKVEMEPTVDGSSFQTVTTLKVINLPELSMSMSQILDVVDINNIGIIRPELQTDYHTVEQTDVQEIIGLELSSMAQEVYNGQNDPAKNNMLLINTKANNMAIDQRLLIPQAPPSNKIPEVIKQVIIDYAESTPVSGTQLIFLDTGVYGGNTFDLYSEIKNDLIKKGIPESEIAFAQQAKNEKQLEEIFEGVRHGKIRVLMGSTAKMGEGVEVQNKGYSLHHIDIGIRPDIVRQRDGRLQRQGNENKTVKRHIYITKGSSDTRNAKIVDRKAQIIDAVLMGNVTEREFEEQRDMTAADIMSLSTGNDAIQRKIELDAQLSELESLRFVHNRKVLHARQQITSLEKKVGITGQVLSFYEQLSDYLSSNTHPVFSINGEVYKNKFFMSKLNTELKSKGVAYFELYGLKCEYTMYLSITNELTPLFKLPATSLNDELDADTSVSRESILKLKNAIDVKKLDELIIEIKHAQKADDHSLSEFHKLIQNPEFSNSSKLQELQKQQIELTLEVQEASRLKEAAWTGPKTIAEWAEKNGVIIESEKSSQTNLQMKM